MWQLFTFGALIFESAEEVVDKIIIVGDMAINSAVATFYRNLIYFLFAAVLGLTGIFGHLSFLMTWPIVFVGLLATGSSVFYTYLLKHVELTGSSALNYARPAIFLLIDILVLKARFSGHEILGIVLLILGGMLFVVNPLTWEVKKQYTKHVWLIFAYETIAYAAEFYIFKHYVTAKNLNEVSYIFSTYVFVVIGLFILALYKHNWKDFARTAKHNHYMAKITLSKAFDFFYSLLWYHAIKLAAVSQVNALESFYPLILLVLLYFTQEKFKFDAGEKLDRTSLFQKSLATAILVAGAWLTI